MTTKAIKWGRSEDGYVDSKCRRYKIKPLYFGCVKPQWFEARYYAEVISRWCSTQREAKEVCEGHLQKVTKEKP